MKPTEQVRLARERYIKASIDIATLEAARCTIEDSKSCGCADTLNGLGWALNYANAAARDARDDLEECERRQRSAG